MIFRADSIDLILRGKKTQTRRPVGMWEQWRSKYEPSLMIARPMTDITEVHITRPDHFRRKWAVGRTYAVCPGRGKHQVARIKLNGLRCQRLCDIPLDDCFAEGLSIVAASGPGIDGVYRYGYDSKKGYDTMWVAPSIGDAYIEMVQTMYRKLEETDLVWVLDFDLEKP